MAALICELSTIDLMVVSVRSPVDYLVLIDLILGTGISVNE